MKAFIKIATAFLVAFVILVITVEKAGVETIGVALSILLSYHGAFLLLLTLGICLVSILRWRGVMKEQRGEIIPFKETAKIWLTGYAADHVTPMELLGGGPVRILLARNKLKITYGEAIASVIVDKVIDATFFISFLIGGVFIFFILGNELSLIFVIAGILILSAAALFLFYFYLRVLERNSVFLWIFKRFAGEKHRDGKGEKLVEEVERKIKDFFENRKEVAKVVGYSFLRELFRWGRVIFLVLILAGSFELEKSLAVYGLANLSLILPLPAGIGTLEAISGYAFHSFGWGFDAGTTLALVWHGIILLLAVIGGVLGVIFAMELIPDKVEKSLDKVFKKSNKEGGN